MNVYDSARMGEHLAQAGYLPIETPEGADIIILNTCHIREKAAEKVYSELGRLKPLKQARPNMVLAVAGCVAQAEGAEIIARAPLVDMVFGPQTFQELPAMLSELAQARNLSRRAHVIRTEFSSSEKFAHLEAQKRLRLSRGASSFITIQEGCNKFCTFCVVPYTRGGEVSRTGDDIVAEAEALVDDGVCEITLLGQNVNAWRDPQEGRMADDLAALLTRLHAIPQLERLRFTTSHPCDMNDTLITAYADLPKLMPYLHLPIQSGSDGVLHAMNRRHTVQAYIDIIAAVRRARPDIAISSDFIVGFPGEQEADFEDTLTLVREIGFAQAFSFKYSPRAGTPGADFESQIDESVKSDRLARLQAVLNPQHRAFLTAQIGQTLPILFDGVDRNGTDFSGRSPYLSPVRVDFPETWSSMSPVGKILPIQITQAYNNSLRGTLA